MSELQQAWADYNRQIGRTITEGQDIPGMDFRAGWDAEQAECRRLAALAEAQAAVLLTARNEAWAEMNRVLEKHGNSPEYRAAWARWETFVDAPHVVLAERDARVLREAASNVRASSFWADGSDNYADRMRGYLHTEAGRIEQEARS